MKKAIKHDRLEKSVLTLALLATFSSMSTTHASEPPHREPDSQSVNATLTNEYFLVSNAAVYFIKNSTFSNDELELVMVEDGGSAEIHNSSLSSNDTATGSKNQHLTAASGKNASIHLDNTKVGINNNLERKDIYHTNGAVVAAENGGRVVIDNTSSIYALDTNSMTKGVKASNGGHVFIKDADIKTEGPWGSAVHLSNALGENATSTETTLDGVVINTKGPHANGIVAINPGSKVIAKNTAVTIHGSYNSGIHALNGAEINFNNGWITTDNILSSGVEVIGDENGKTAIYLLATKIVTQGELSSGVKATADSGDVRLLNSFIDTLGNDSVGLKASKGASIYAVDTAITTQGRKAHGVDATAGSHVFLDANTFRIKGENAFGLHAVDPKTVIDSVADSVTTEGLNGIGVFARDGGVINLKNGTVVTRGANAHGLYAKGRDDLITDENTDVRTSENDTQITAENSDVHTSGSGSVGMLAKNGGVINFSGDVTVVDAPSSGDQGHKTVSGLVAMGGVLFTVDLEPTTGFIESGKILVRKSIITVTGDGSIGAKAGEQIDGKKTYGDIRLDGSRIVAKGKGARAAEVSFGSVLDAKDSVLVSEMGDGIVINDSGTVNLQSTTIKSGGASLVANLLSADQKQDISLVDARLEENDGILLRVNRADVGMNGIVNLSLSGAKTYAVGDIIDVDGLDKDGNRIGNGTTNFVVADRAFWVGRQHGLRNLTVGDQAHLIDHGGSSITGDVTGGQQTTIEFLKKIDIAGNVTLGSASSAQFDGPTSIGSNLSADSARFAFSPTELTTIRGNVDLRNKASLGGGAMSAPLLIDGNVRVASLSILGGNLHVAGELDAAGGIVRPGNSIGKQTFGSIKNLGDTYIAEVNAAGQSDLIVAQRGDVDVSNTNLLVSQEGGDGGFKLNHNYTILQTETGSISGKFASTDLDESFDETLVHLAPLAYNPQDVQIRLEVDTDKVETTAANLRENQAQALNSVVSVAGTNASADAALLSSNVRVALNQLSGEIHASTQSALLYSSSHVQETLSERVRAGFGASEPTLPVWAQATGGTFSLNGNSNAAKAKTDTGGIFIGGDTEIAQGWRLGAAMGYTHSTTKVQDRASSKSDMNSYTAALYSGKSWERINGQVNFLAGAAYTHSDINTRRHVALSGNETLKADYNAKSTQVFTEAGYGFNVGEKAQVGPYAGFSWMHLNSNSFEESGGPAALSGKGNRDNLFSTTLGLRGKTQLEIGATRTFVQGALGWRHTTDDINPSRSMAFIAGNGATFSIAGAPIAKNAAVVSLGIGTDIGKSTTVGLTYGGQFAKGQTDNNGSLFMKVGF